MFFFDKMSAKIEKYGYFKGYLYLCSLHSIDNNAIEAYTLERKQLLQRGVQLFLSRFDIENYKVITSEENTKRDKSQ